MLKLTKTGIGLLTKQYRSVLRKCLLLNLGIFTSITLITQSARGSISISSGASLGSGGVYNHSDGIGIGERNTVVYSNLGIALGDYAIAGLSTNPSDTLSAYNITGVGGIDLTGLTAGSYAVALGSYSGASGLYSSAVGHRAYAIGNETAVLGNHAIARADYSVVLGSSSSTSEDYVISVGHKSTDLSWDGSAWGEDLFRRIVNVAAGQNDNDVVILKQLNDALNYYYTFRVGKSNEVTDYTSFFQKDFLTLQKVDLQSKNPTHLGAFTKCDEVCPRPSERFVSSLSQEQMFKNDASVDAGTSRHCLRQFGDVLADLLKNTAAKSLRISEFMNEEVRHA